MIPEYSAYASASGNDTSISTLVTVEGYTDVQPTAGCNLEGVTHQGRVYNMLSTTGGWEDGPKVAPADYISVTNSQSIAATPGVSYPFSWEGAVYCSELGLFYANVGSGNLENPTISGPQALWYFNGQNPSGFATSITLTASADGTWEVTSGSDRINLSASSGTSITVTPTGSHFSGAKLDTCVVVTVSSFSSAPFCLTVRTPWELVADPDDTYTTKSDTNGYSTSLGYNVYDNLYVVLSASTFWNEVVGTSTSQNGSNWGMYGTVSSPGDTQPLQDFLSGPGLKNSPPPLPTPTYNNPPSGQTVFCLARQSIYVGSNAEPGGVGTLVQSDNLTYWIDHGTHSSIVEPPRPPQ